MKIANKISISFLSVALILASIVVSIFYSIAKDSLQKSIYNNLATACCFRSDHIKTYLKMLEISVGQLSKSVVLEDFLKISGKENPRQGEAFEQAMIRLKRTKEVNPAIAEFLLLDKTGKVVASSNESSLGTDKSRDAYFLEGQRGEYIKDVYYSETLKTPLMAVSAPLLDSQSGEFLGVLVSRVRLTDLNNITTSEIGLGKTGEIYIVNKYGFMISPSRFKEDAVLKQKVDTQNVREAWLHKDVEHLLSQHKLADVFSDYRGVQVLGAHEYIPQMQWAVLAEIDAKEAFAPLAKLRLIFLMILFIVPIAAWVLGISLAKLITDPLHKLHKGTEIIGSGNLDYKVGTDAKDEVGQLSRAFDTMTENLRQTTVSINTLNQEIAERKKAQELQGRLSSIIEATSDFVGFADAKDKHIIYMNKAGRKMVGVDEDEDVTKLKISDVHPEWTNKMLAEEILPVAVRDGTWTGECAFLNIRDRREIPVLMALSSHKAADGEVEVFSAISRDIAERKRAEEALKESEGRFRAIFDHANDGILLADEETKKFYTGNNTICQMLGYSLEEIKNLGVADIHPKENLPYVIEQFQRQVRKEIAVARDLPVKRKDGSVFYADVNSSSVTLNARTYILGLFRDITERRRAEGVLTEAMKVKSDFTSTVSHELRTPLTAIKEGIAIVLDGSAGVLNAEQKDFLGLAKRNVDRLARLINDVLDFQKLEAQKMVFNIQENDINELLKEVHSSMAPLADKKNLKFTLTLQEGLPRVNFDRDRIVQVLTNLVSNAIKFTEKGSIVIASSGGDNIIRVSVKDSGPGVKVEDMGRLFQQFSQLEKITERKTGGTGLGLAISKEIIERHKGRIWAESPSAGEAGEFGKGTTFWFILPVKTKDKVLVIDDDKAMLDIIKNFLEKKGHGVICSEKGLDAVAIIGKDKPDLVILDMKLKDTSGYEIIGRLRSNKETSRTPIIAMSGYSEELSRIGERQEELALVSIAKPFNLEDLSSIVRKLLQR